jgi:hypothetical protein
MSSSCNHWVSYGIAQKRKAIKGPEMERFEQVAVVVKGRDSGRKSFSFTICCSSDSSSNEWYFANIMSRNFTQMSGGSALNQSQCRKYFESSSESQTVL